MNPVTRAFGVLAPALLTCAAAGQQYDLSAVTNLAQGAVVGVNVETPIRGFELLLLKDGRPVYHRAFGTWSINRVANADSATKTLSGALIMSLVDSSPVPFSLDTRLSDHIPEFNGGMRLATIRQAFSHFAGFRNSDVVGDRDLTLYEAALVIADETLLFLPGTAFYYGGASMHAAGAVAEIVGDASWNTLFHDRLAAPLGFVDTRYVLTTPQNPRIAGGCESTAAEFARFMEMLRQGGVHNGERILSEAAVQQMFTRQTPIDIPVAGSPLEGSADYGVGVWLDHRDTEGNLIGAIAAGARGFSCWIDFDDGMVGAFATDLSPPDNVYPLLELIRDAAEAAVQTPFPCNADYFADGTINSQDFFEFLAAFFSEALTADFNADATINSQDLFDFLANFFAGC